MLGAQRATLTPRPAIESAAVEEEWAPDRGRLHAAYLRQYRAFPSTRAAGRARPVQSRGLLRRLLQPARLEGGRRARRSLAGRRGEVLPAPRRDAAAPSG